MPSIAIEPTSPELLELPTQLRLQHTENTEVAVRYLQQIQKELNDTEASRRIYRDQFLGSVKSIGENLQMLRTLYETTKDFQHDMEQTVGLKRASVCNYMDLADRWDDFSGYLARMGPDKEPVLTLTRAMRVVRALPEFIPEDATEEELQALDRQTDSSVSSKEKGTATTRNFHLKVLPTLEKLTNFSSSRVTPEEKARIKALRSELLEIIGAIEERDRNLAATPPKREPAPAAPAETGEEQQAQPEEEEQQAQAKQIVPTIKEIYPCSSPAEAQAVLNALQDDAAKHGSGYAYARAMGWGDSTVGSYCSKLRKLINEADQSESAVSES